jgi:hypothetical protein
VVLRGHGVKTLDVLPVAWLDQGWTPGNGVPAARRGPVLSHEVGYQPLNGPVNDCVTLEYVLQESDQAPQEQKKYVQRAGQGPR